MKPLYQIDTKQVIPNFFSHPKFLLKIPKITVSKFHNKNKANNCTMKRINSNNNETFYETFMKLHETFFPLGIYYETWQFHNN